MKRYESYEEDVTKNFKELQSSLTLVCIFVLGGLILLAWISNIWMLFIGGAIGVFFIYIIFFTLVDNLKKYLISKSDR